MTDEITSIMLQQIQEIEQRDESQILAELAGEAVLEYIYQIEVWDSKARKKVRKVKLSWVGVKEVARSRGNLVLSEPTICDTEDALRVVVKATDLTRNFTVFGGCHQPKTQKVKDIDQETGAVIGDKIEPDLFYFQKALSKAQRNALNLCIPGDYAARFIDRFLKLAGKPALPPGKAKQIAQGNVNKVSKLVIKPQADWDAIKREDVPTLPTLERVMWNLAKLQPRQMYQELGYVTRADVIEPAWECFLRLKDRFTNIPSEAV